MSDTPMEDWKKAVLEGETTLGYEEWVEEEDDCNFQGSEDSKIPITELKYDPEDDAECVDQNQKIVQGGVTVFFKPDEEHGEGFGFKFVCCEWAGESGDTVYVDTICYGWAAFDGTRHMHWGSEYGENCGYMHYPSWNRLDFVISTLKELEQKYCNDCPNHD